jgi:hypothetical protein
VVEWGPPRLRKVLEDLLDGKPPWDAEPGTLDLFHAACTASSVSEEECDRIYDKSREAMMELTFAGKLLEDRYKPVAEAVRKVISRFELKGRCLVEKGVSVEDPSVCEGSIDDGLVIVGSRMQFFVNRQARGAVARVGDACAVAVGASSAWGHWALDKLRSGRLGLLEYDEVGAVLSVGTCGLGDLPRLAEEAAILTYSEVYDGCRIEWGREGEETEEELEAEEEAEWGELEECLKILKRFEGG